jgi:PIN domain nuclease of toxin-antitoxin system
VIVLDTHEWVWWVSGNVRLRPYAQRAIADHTDSGLVVSAISFWEVAKLVERGRLSLGQPPRDWLELAINFPGVRVVGLTPDIVIDATSLPGTFHRDPADQLIVATARVLNVQLLTEDARILAYPHVQLIAPP